MKIKNFSLNLSCESNAFQGILRGRPERPMNICLNLSCESNAFQGDKVLAVILATICVLISLARVMLFREYPSGTRINKGLQRAVLNNCTEKHLLEF